MVDKKLIELGLILTMDHCVVKDGLEDERVVAGDVKHKQVIGV